MTDYQTYGLLGERVSGSQSPQIYNAMFQELNVPAVYMPFPVPKEQFISALPVLRSSFAGFNVEVPFRLDIMPHLDRLDISAKKAGAANTVLVENRKLTGYNTDMVGFDRSLIGFVGNMYDKDVLLIGSGGAAHAIANILLEKGAFVTIISRHIASAVMLQEFLHEHYNKNRVRVVKGLSHSDTYFAIFNTAAVDIESRQSEIAVHTHTYQNLKFAYDVSFHKTAFLKKAKDFGAKVKTGFDMLFYTSARSLEIWLGKDKGLDASSMAVLYERILRNII